jgi:integrase
MTGFLASLRKFYEGNDIENIRWHKLSGYMGELTPKNEDRCYTHEEIHTLLDNSDLKLKVVILLMASAGLRVGALPTLLVSHLEKKGSVYKISVYKGLKGKGKYYTFCSPECVTVIDTYLQYRERCGEKITPDSPLLRKDFDSSFKASKIVPATYDGIRMSVYTLLVKSGIRIVGSNRRKRNDISMTHGFRKFYETMLVNSNIHETIIRKLTGHSEIGNLTQRYARQTEDEMLEEYMKAVDNLTINPENRLKRKVELLTIEKSKVDLALSQIEDMKKRIGLT